jgi:tetratricopeptide (TPR) repeat protein
MTWLRKSLPSSGIEVLAARLPVGETGASDADREISRQVRGLLHEKGADLAIWGRVAIVGGREQRLELRFFVVDAMRAAVQRFCFTERMRLDANLGAEAGMAIAAVAAIQAVPAGGDSGAYFAGILMPMAERLGRAVRNMAASVSAHDRAEVLHSFALVQSVIAERSGESARIQEAVEAYREALQEWTRAGAPLEWARAQNNLGVALLMGGAGDMRTELLEQAAEGFAKALQAWPRYTMPVEWAMAQSNLGSALLRLGTRAGGAEILQQAALACREALKGRTRERTPVEWAKLQNNLGATLTILGARERGSESLKQAVEAFHEALKEWTRGELPANWASTQNNLGAALTKLGGRENGPEHLDAAVEAHRQALKVFTREQRPGVGSDAVRTGRRAGEAG